MQSNRKPLSGVTILDFSQYLPGPLCSQHLGDMGADVIKVESRKGGDLSRPSPNGETSRMFLLVNRNKRSLSIDLRQPEGVEIVHRLVRTLDVVIDGFRPGVMDRLGVGYEALSAINPKLVFCAITGYGQNSPLAAMGGHDINYQSLSGALEQSGQAGGPPAAGGFQIGDIAGGTLSAAMGILAALFDAQRSGQGRFVDVAMTDAAMAHMVMPLAAMQTYGQGRPVPRGEDFTSGRLPCYGIYETADGRHLALGALEPQFWKAFCDAANRPDLVAKGWLLEEPAAGQAKSEIAALVQSRSLAEWAALLQNVDACSSPVLRLDEVLQHHHTRARGMLVAGTTPEGKPYEQFAFPIKMSGFQFEVQQAPPALGQHNQSILQSLGYSPEDISTLAAKGVA